MADSTGRRSWNRAQTKGRRISEDVVVALFVLLALDLCVCGKSYAVQRDDLRRVGMLFRGLPPPKFKDQFRKSLAERGWVEGRNIIIEERSGKGKKVRLEELARELINAKADVIIANSAPAARAAIVATKTLPIVVIGGNPVADGLVANAARPEANVTGVSGSESPEISGKRLELLQQAFPSIARVAILVRPEIHNHTLHLNHTRVAAKKLGISVQAVELEHLYRIENAFSRMVQPQAVLILPWAMDLPYQRKMILQSAAKHRLPTVYTRRHFVKHGGFMSYGPVHTHTRKRAAMLVDKLLKGASPAELPVERPLHYELVINLKTANSFGLTVAPELLLQADEVIR
jgi:putative ABC transport system substrate-binding protein